MIAFRSLLIAAGLMLVVPAFAQTGQDPHHPAAGAQGQTSQPASPPAGAMGSGMMGPGMMRDGMMGRGMGYGMMGGGMMGPGTMMSPFPMRIMFALMDADGDGTVSLQEFQTAHERIFKAMDGNKDGVLSLEEIQAFMRGTRSSAPQPSSTPAPSRP
jgi:EF hand